MTNVVSLQKICFQNPEVALLRFMAGCFSAYETKRLISDPTQTLKEFEMSRFVKFENARLYVLMNLSK